MSATTFSRKYPPPTPKKYKNDRRKSRQWARRIVWRGFYLDKKGRRVKVNRTRGGLTKKHLVLSKWSGKITTRKEIERGKKLRQKMKEAGKLAKPFRK